VVKIDAYDVNTPALLLVRPDNYVGLATTPDDRPAVAAYLDLITPRRAA
jgi:hypothetical protein